MFKVVSHAKTCFLIAYKCTAIIALVTDKPLPRKVCGFCI